MTWALDLSLVLLHVRVEVRLLERYEVDPFPPNEAGPVVVCEVSLILLPLAQFVGNNTMFSRIAATSGKTALLAAGSAIGGASGATYLLSGAEKNAANCEAEKPTVMSLLSDISSRVSKIEESMGIPSASSASSGAATSSKKYGGQSELARRQTMASADYGIDIVLGAQWGDEGKGKLVDMLSQVRRVHDGERTRCMYFPRQAQHFHMFD